MYSEDLWKERIRNKLVALFQNDEEALCRILHYLDQEELAYRDDPQVPPVWKTLKALVSSDSLVKKFGKRLIEDTKTAEKDPHFRETMRVLYAQMIVDTEDALPDDHNQGFDIVRVKDASVALKAGATSLAKVWVQLSPNFQTRILGLIEKIAINTQIVSSVDEVGSLVSPHVGTIVMASLAAVYLSAAAIINLWRWWHGQISGKRCLKNILDSTLTITAGVGGGMAGVALGSLGGPIGMFAGGIIGGALSSYVVNIVSDRLTQSLFGIPKEEALENAYNFLGVQMTASNSDINTSFHKLCLKSHPDKPSGSPEKFFEVQLHMATIKAARGALY